MLQKNALRLVRVKHSELPQTVKTRVAKEGFTEKKTTWSHDDAIVANRNIAHKKKICVTRNSQRNRGKPQIKKDIRDMQPIPISENTQLCVTTEQLANLRDPVFAFSKNHEHIHAFKLVFESTPAQSAKTNLVLIGSLVTAGWDWLDLGH